MPDAITKDTWPGALYDLLRANGVTQFCYVPDAGHKVLIDRSLADDDVHSIPLTTEEEGVAMVCGADLGGDATVSVAGVSVQRASSVGR